MKIESINIAEQTVLPNGNVVFGNAIVRTKSFSCCNGFHHNDGSALFNINRPGIYKITYNANVTAAAAGTIQQAIKVNGEVLQGSQMVVTNAAGNTYNISATRLIRVCGNGSASITIANTGATPITVANPNIIIED